MLTRARLIALPWLLPALALGQAVDLSKYSLTSAAADKFVTATRQMMASGAGPNMQGNPLQNLPKIKESIDSNAAARKALADVGLSSTDYVSFMGAAAQAMMVGQMEGAGMKGMLPPGVTARPPQGNIDFMKTNADLFQRAMSPAGSAAASARPRATAGDEALPMPKLGTVWPSDLLAKLPKLSAITATTDCKLGGMQEQAQREQAKATELQAASYGNPGDNGLARTPAEGTILKRLEDVDLVQCGVMTNFSGVGFKGQPELDAAEQARQLELTRIGNEYQTGYNACPGIPGGKDPACERAVGAKQAQQTDAAERRYLEAATKPYSALFDQMRTCDVQRETVVKDAVTANVRGYNVKEALRPLVAAWELPVYAAAFWSGACEDAQRYLLKK